MPRLVRVASVEEIPAGRGKTVEVEGRLLAVFHAGDGRYLASTGRCPHDDRPIGAGTIEGTVVICPWHGFDFDLTTGACLFDPDLSIETYPVRVEGQDILVELP